MSLSSIFVSYMKKSRGTLPLPTPMAATVKMQWSIWNNHLKSRKILLLMSKTTVILHAH